MNKVVFCDALSKLREPAGLEYVHRSKSVTILGPIGCETGNTQTTLPDGSTRTTTVLNVFAKEDIGWRLVFAMPADILRKALTEVDGGKTRERRNRRPRG